MHKIIHPDIINNIKRNLKSVGVTSKYKIVNKRQYLIVNISDNVNIENVSSAIRSIIPSAIAGGNRINSRYYRLNP